MDGCGGYKHVADRRQRPTSILEQTLTPFPGGGSALSSRLLGDLSVVNHRPGCL
jgi:hypothetical protein